MITEIFVNAVKTLLGFGKADSMPIRMIQQHGKITPIFREDREPADPPMIEDNQTRSDF